MRSETIIFFIFFIVLSLKQTRKRKLSSEADHSEPQRGESVPSELHLLIMWQFLCCSVLLPSKLQLSCFLDECPLFYLPL